jgi:hypothetical protein
MVKAVKMALMSLLIFIACSPVENRSDRQLIEDIMADLAEGAASGDLMKIETHLSTRAKQTGYDSNRFVMECSYGQGVQPEFNAQSIKVMGDSAHVMFVLQPLGRSFNNSQRRSFIRLTRSNEWEIESFEILKN